MRDIKLVIFQLLICIISWKCEHPKQDIFGMAETECKVWWLYDKALGDGPTHVFICLNKKKYNCLSIYKSGKVQTRKQFKDPFWGGHDVIYPLIELGSWEIKYDSLFLQDKGFSPIKKVTDTIFLRPDAFLLDQTDKFHIENCDCDSFVAQFKGGVIDSIKTVLNYKNPK
jgi:hypothetical protein